jgi:hypothetical protein
MANPTTVTFGSGSAPSAVTTNLDSLFGLSLAAYRKELIDNIGATNAFFHEVLSRELYEGQDGGTYIQTPVMYGLAPADSYDGYDELSTVPTDGITDCIYQWRQCAAPIVYSMKEVKQNKQKIIDLVKSRIKQGEMGLQEFFAQAFMWGSANQSGGSLTTPYVSPVNGSLGIEPITEMIDYNTTTANTAIGNINQNTNTWWQNKRKVSAATTYDGFILEVDQIFNQASLGTGGKVKLVLFDETSYELFIHALYQKFRYVKPTTDEAYPFENVVYKGAHFVMDDKVPDVANGIVPTLSGGAGDPSTLVNGTGFFINPSFFKMIYEEDSDFKMLEDDSGKTFFKPVNGDSRVGHMAWMGNTVVNNRRKQGVLGHIARTLVTP